MAMGKSNFLGLEYFVFSCDFQDEIFSLNAPGYVQIPTPCLSVE